ncbi:glycerophosphoryl diester phosphodiesterase membrane domain-containing protein [Acetivibrio clariflavus]|uniref:Glycerophosphoryl diester phosphodiesterase-like protein n=1 Tax=Acetivibrio clariflavus (strain DSM 19732 / NBRC 101661 / EBR45) TaxID=720554 RepID=G8M202_ACECE|nr:glycerophosphoryl diester phosphodiesterase membrane domain-containing protein [Acetivibrio clariflavus]AEV68120.1 glycerophosphoryl diester phosphodiesterase-like protein [Acetivibrio clariflavus DSM 19732]
MSQVGNHLKPMNIGDVLDYSVEAFKQNFKGIVLLSLILYIPWTVLYSIIVNVLVDNNLADVFNIYRDLFNGVFSPEMADRYLTDAPLINSTMASLLSMLQMVYSITFKLVLNAAVIKMIYGYAISGEVKVNSLTDVKTLIKESFKFMPKMMGNAVIFVLILATAYIVSISVAVLFVIAPVMMVSTLYLPPVLLAVTIVFLIIFVVLGVLFAMGFFAVKLIFGAHIIVIEDKSVSESIRRSFNLTKGKFWHIAFSGIFALMLYYLFNSLLIGATMIVAVVNNTLYIIVNAFSQMCSAIAEPFILVFITILFINMKIQKEGLDLEIKMRKLIENEKARYGESVNG